MTALNQHEAALLARLPLTVTDFKAAAQRPDVAISPAAFLARMREAGYAAVLGATVVRTRAGTAALGNEATVADLDRAALVKMIADYKREHAEEIAEAAHRRKVHLLSYLKREGRLS